MALSAERGTFEEGEWGGMIRARGVWPPQAASASDSGKIKVSRVSVMQITVLGSGVIGLSVANELARRGHTVTMVSGERPAETTSAVAAAYWAPYWIGDYDRRWGEETLSYLQRLAGMPGTGTSRCPFRELLTAEGAKELRAELDQAYWWRHLPGIQFRWVTLERPEIVDFPDLGRMEFVEAVEFESVVARMPDYLAYLEGLFLRQPGAAIQSRWVASLDELLVGETVVVNCTGWGAKLLCQEDPQTRSMRLLAGHVVRVETAEQKTAVSLHRGPFKQRPLYIVPRAGSAHDVICGGTAIEQSHLDPRQAFGFSIDDECEAIYRNCRVFSQAVAQGHRCENLVGLRPVRSAVRVERDPNRPRLYHGYGHGGSGLTLSYGTARCLADLVEGG
jgi:D-amino-acid oxidase